MRRSLDASRGEAAFGADLGCSSKHSAETDRSAVAIPRAGAEKGFSSTAFERELVDPKPMANALFVHSVSYGWRKGIRL